MTTTSEGEAIAASAQAGKTREDGRLLRGTQQRKRWSHPAVKTNAAASASTGRSAMHFPARSPASFGHTS